MLVRLFQKYQWHTPFLLIVAGLALWRRAFLNPEETLAVTGENNGPLFDSLMPFFLNYPVTAVILTFAAVTFQAFFVTHVASSKVMKNRFSAVAGLIFLLLVSSRPEMIAVQPGHFSGVFVLLALNKILNTYTDKDIILQIFNAGVLISLAGLFYFPAWTLFLLLIISLFIYYVFTVRTFLAALTGFVTPLFFIFTILWVSGQLDSALLSLARYQSTWTNTGISFSFYDRFYLYTFGFLTVLSLFSLRLLHMPSKAIRIRRRMYTLSVALMVAALSYLLAGNHILINHSLLFIPLSVSLAVFFEDMGNSVRRELLFLLMTAILVAGHMLA